MGTQLSITRKALLILGDFYDISSASEESAEAEAMAEVFDDARKEALKMGPWTFALTHETLTENTSSVDGTALPNLWTKSYARPSDLLLALNIVNPLGRNREPIPFEEVIVEISAAKTLVLLTDQGSAELRYIFDQGDLTMFTPEAEWALAMVLAAKTSMALHGDYALSEKIMDNARSYVSTALAQNANVSVEDAEDSASWHQARGVGLG